MKKAEEILAQNIRAFRKKINMTQEELAKSINFTEKAVSKWELGDCMPSVSTIVNIAQVLGTDVNTLVGYTFKPQFYLGIDGGATKTDFKLCDNEGNVVNYCKLQGCNPVDIGIENSKKVFRDGIEAVCKDIPLSMISVFAGISGGTTGRNKTEINRLLGEYGFTKFSNGSDIENAIAVALNKNNGIVAIMGTGSIIYAINDKERHRIGGYGYYFDDGGSGFDIGCAVLKCSLNAKEKSGKQTMLLEMCEEKLENTIVESLGEIYSRGKTYVASFAPLAFTAYEKGDIVAKEIIENSMERFSKKLLCAKRYFSNENIPIHLVGGLCKDSNIFLPILKKYMGENESIVICNKKQVDGALILAGLEV